jgi:L-ribulose-5-phosphate 4-epimerase
MRSSAACCPRFVTLQGNRNHMLEALREAVLEANLDLVRRGLVLFTFGNASGIDRERGLVAIKPSGVPYENMGATDLVITDLEGRLVEGSLRPSSDLATHLELYKAFPQIGGVVHTHSRFATSWAQAAREIPCLGTTHADYFHGPVPLTEHLTIEEIEQAYEKATGEAIVRRFQQLNPMAFPGVLVTGHAPFTWGKTPAEAVMHAAILEEIATLAYYATTLNSACEELASAVMDKHHLRKHGPNAYYGQVE